MKALRMFQNLNIIKEVPCANSMGPPGTGKTKTISILLYSLLIMNCRTLACAPKNIAVAELALCILNLHKDPGCLLGDFLLFGTMNRLELCDELGKISVDHRVDSLVECFAPLTGWKKHFASVVDFLEDCVSQYRFLLQNEIITEVHVMEKIGTTPEVHTSVRKFAKDLFKALAVPLKRNIKVADKELEELFARQENYLKEAQGSRAFNFTSATLQKMRIEIVQVLRSVSHSLVSSSYNLHEVDLEPLDLLVIDGASQLKECESVIPTQLKAIRHAVLIGDECHPEARVKSRVSDEAAFGRSSFKRLGLFGHSEDLLNIQYRMHPEISYFPNRKFYKDHIIDAPSVFCENFQSNYLPGPMFVPYSFINISNGREELDEAGHNMKNMDKVAVVMAIVPNLYMNKVGQKYEKLKDFVVKVSSADGFYGGEVGVIIISTVGANHSGGSYGFFPIRSVLMHCLWILGNDKNLCKIGSFWEDLIQLVKAMIKANKELDQLDNLLNEDSMLFKSASWKVLFSNNFRKSFEKLKSSETQKSVVNLLVKLSNGWRPKKSKVESLCGNFIDLQRISSPKFNSKLLWTSLID
ncbi:hypothetical protein MKX01_012174 [Papaver californicum]|nr:hypothetical protein MKX01_012174 [Papaver californicum]